jgi:anti-sigma B factor antagonist
VAQFLVALDEAIETEPPAIDLDLGGLAFMDSSGVGAYVHAFRRARSKNVPLTIRERSPAVDRVLELSGVEEALTAEGGGHRSTP